MGGAPAEIEFGAF